MEEYYYMLGLSPRPEKTPLAAKITGTLQGDGYTVEMLHYQSRPRLYVTANLILTLLVGLTGSDIFVGQGIWPLVLSVVFGSLATAGLHRLKEAFERRSPHDPDWEAKHKRAGA